MALLNPYLNPYEQTNDEIDDILFISDRERIVSENEKMKKTNNHNMVRRKDMATWNHQKMK